MTEIETELNRLEEEVRKGDEPGIRARWQSGKALLALREGGKALPKGVRQFMKDALGVSGSEINARIRLAEECRDEAALSDVVREFGSWHAITHKALIKSPRPKVDNAPFVEEGGDDVDTDTEDHDGQATRSVGSQIHGALDILRELDPADMNDNDVALLRDVIKFAERWINAVARLRDGKAA